MVPTNAFDDYFIQKEVGETDEIFSALDWIKYHF